MGALRGSRARLPDAQRGLAHAISPGILHSHPQDPDPLATRTRRVVESGRGLDDYEGRVYRYALTLRPLMRDALEDETLTLEELLFAAFAEWDALVEAEGR